MSASYNVDILTPSSVVAKNMPAESLFVPTTRGQINLLEGHTHFVTKLATGILTIVNGASQRNFSMTTGVCKVLNNKVIILSNVTEEAHLIDIERAERALVRAQKKLKEGALSDIEIIKYQRKAERAEARVRAAYLGKNIV